MKRIVLTTLSRGLFVLGLFAAILQGSAIKVYAEGENTLNPQQLPDSSFIYDTSIIDLSTADPYYNGQTVQVVGEAVGDSIHADAWSENRWITLSATDTTVNASVSVFMSEENAAKIDMLGKYGETGTRLQVRGIFNLVCSEHDGLTDLHAEYVSVVAPGASMPDQFDMFMFVPGALTVITGLILMGVFYYMRERQR